MPGMVLFRVIIFHYALLQHIYNNLELMVE